MYCANCGTALEEGTRFCSECGSDNEAPAVGASRPQPSPPRPNATAAAAAQIRAQVGSSSRDAIGALRTMLIEPVSGLPSAYSSLGDQRAFAAGMALCVGFALAGTASVLLGAHAFGGLTNGLVDASSKIGLKDLFQMFIVFLVPPGTLFAVVLGLSRVFGQSGSAATAAFSVGASLSPVGIALLASGLLGVANFEVIFLLFFLAASYLILMLYTGLSQVCGVSEKASAPAVPIVLLLAAWLSKVVLVAFISHGG